MWPWEVARHWGCSVTPAVNGARHQGPFPGLGRRWCALRAPREPAAACHPGIEQPPGAGPGAPVTGPPALPSVPASPSHRQCPARRRGRWRRRRSTPRPSACCGGPPRRAGSMARSAATRSTTCAWRAPRPRGRRASRTSCWLTPRWVALWGAGGGLGGGCAPPRAPALSLLPSLATRSSPPLSPAAASHTQWEMDDTAEYVSSASAAGVLLPRAVPAVL